MEIKERRITTHDITINDEEKNAIYTTQKILRDLSNYDLEFIDVEGHYFGYDDYYYFLMFLECFLTDDRIDII